MKQFVVFKRNQKNRQNEQNRMNVECVSLLLFQCHFFLLFNLICFLAFKNEKQRVATRNNNDHFKCVEI